MTVVYFSLSGFVFWTLTANTACFVRMLLLMKTNLLLHVLLEVLLRWEFLLRVSNMAQHTEEKRQKQRKKGCYQSRV